MVTIVIPRELLSEAKGLPEIPKRGIYYLLDDNKGRLKRVYAGQTVQGIQRLDDHNQRKDWWNKAVMFLAPDTEFSMDVVSGLESIAIKYIKEHGAYEVENTNDPKPYISPYNEAFILHSWRIPAFAGPCWDLGLMPWATTRQVYPTRYFTRFGVE